METDCLSIDFITYVCIVAAPWKALWDSNLDETIILGTENFEYSVAFPQQNQSLTFHSNSEAV